MDDVLKHGIIVECVAEWIDIIAEQLPFMATLNCPINQIDREFYNFNRLYDELYPQKQER